jgi:glyoxalase family protein
MGTLVKGIHHITAIASDPQATYDFYTGVLGLRLVKKTVNQDDVEAYHLFFGDRTGEPGMDLTFFVFQPVMKGLRGSGQVTTISLTVPTMSLPIWQKRFQTHHVKHEEVASYFGHPRLVFYDPDDQRLELVGVEDADLDTQSESLWTTSEVTKSTAIRAFYSARLTTPSLQMLEPILTQALGYEVSTQSNNLTLFHLPGQKRARYLEVEESPGSEPGITAAGTVHHIAFQVENEAEQLKVRQKINELGLFPTRLIDRYYFKSVYFRTPAGILFELATLGPGFTADEPEAELGEHLSLPPFLEDQRSEIEANLSPIKTDGE